MRLYVILAGLLTCAAATPAFAGPMAEARAYVSLSTSAGGDLAITGTTSVQSTSSGNGNVSITKTANAQYIMADVVTSLDSYGESDASEMVSLSDITVKNTSNSALSALIDVFFSSSIGSDAATDVGSTEYALFSSSLGGTNVDDEHGCSLSPSGYQAVGATEITLSGGQTHCAVPAPDSSESFFNVDLAPGESQTLPIDFDVDVSARVAWTPVPEPASVGLLAFSIMALAFVRRRA